MNTVAHIIWGILFVMVNNVNILIHPINNNSTFEKETSTKKELTLENAQPEKKPGKCLHITINKYHNF